MPTVRQFIVRGRLTLDGVDFVVQAKDSQEAIEKAKAGEWLEWVTDGAEAVDWKIRNEAEEN